MRACFRPEGFKSCWRPACETGPSEMANPCQSKETHHRPLQSRWNGSQRMFKVTSSCLFDQWTWPPCTGFGLRHGRVIGTPFGLRSSRGGGGSRPPFAARLRSSLRLRRRRSDHHRCGTIRPLVLCERRRARGPRPGYSECLPMSAFLGLSGPERFF